MADSTLKDSSNQKKKKSSPGRPTKLTKELQDKICLYLKYGNYVETAAAACGVSKVILYAWLKRGTEHKAPGIYKDFLNAIEKAQAEAETRDLVNIENSASGSAAVFDSNGNQIRAERKSNWTASAWRLERRHPTKWGHLQKLELTGKNGGPIQIDEAALDREIEHFAGVLGFKKDGSK